MSKVDDELTRRLHRAERPVDADAVFEGLERRRSHRERARRVQAGMLAFAVLAATAGGFLFLRNAFEPDERDVGDKQTPTVANGEIVFAKDGDDDRLDIYAAQPDGSDVRQITETTLNDSNPAISADGRTVAFAHDLENGRSVIATVPIEGGAIAWQTVEHQAVADPTWSPDGTRIAFLAFTTDTSELYVAEVNGNDERRILLPGEGNDVLSTGTADTLSHPTWSPDGTRIAVAAMRSTGASSTTWDLATLRPDGTGLDWLVATDDQDEIAPAWSRDGDWVAFTRSGEEAEIWTVDPDHASETLVAFTGGVSVGTDLAWAPDGSALLVSDAEWIYLVEASPGTDPQGNIIQLMRGLSPSWQPLFLGSEPSPTSEPSTSPNPEPEGRDIGLGFNLCNLQQLSGIDLLGDGAEGKAWTGTRVLDDGTCPNDIEDRYGVAVDVTGDGVADSWSGETMEYCVGCMPWRAADLNGDGGEELIVVLQGGTEIEFGLYGVRTIEAGSDSRILPFLVGEPGHEAAGFVAGQPFAFWAGGDEGRSESVYCDELPRYWLTSISSLVDGGADAPSTVHETLVEIGTDGIAHVLDSRTTEGRYPEDVQAPYVTAGPACGIDFNWWQ